MKYRDIIEQKAIIEIPILSRTVIAFTVDYEIAKFDIEDQIHPFAQWFWIQCSKGCAKFELINNRWVCIELGPILDEQALARIRVGPAFGASRFRASFL